MRAATFLLFVLFGVAGLYFLLDYTYLGAAQISVYAGGVTMIYVFAIQLVSKRTLQGMIERIKCSRAIGAALLTLVGLAMVLIIFGMGIYELFINKIDPVERKADARPTWLQISSIDELKSSLGKVILMVLIVSFFKHSLDVPFDSAKDLLQLSVGVLLISGALFLAHKSPK